MARGLAKAHAAGIVHRDLKPANIFLTRRDDGSLLAKILDFGVSKFDHAGTTSEPTLTALGMTLGTPQYMSPEQCVGKLELDGRTDVWSLCAVLYEMIAGEPAIPGGAGHVATMQRIVRQDVAPLARRASWASPELARIIDAGLTRERSARIPNASTLAAKLVEAFPDASQPSLHAGPARPTDVSELSASRTAWSTVPDSHPDADTLQATAATVPTAQAVAEPRPPGQASARPGPPAAASREPSSGPPPSSPPDEVEVFARGGLPSELIALRSRKKE